MNPPCNPHPWWWVLTHGGCGCGYGLRHPWVYPHRALDGLTVWKHLTSDWRFWNQTVQTSQTTRPPDLQTTRLLQTSQTTRPPDQQIIRPFQTTPDQSDHQTTRPLECQTSQTTRQPDPQTVRPLQTQSDQQTSRQSDQSDHQTIRPKDCQTIPDDSRSIRPPDHQIPRLSDQLDN